METKQKKGRINVKILTRTALFAAVICILAPITIPIGIIPITLATFAVYLTGAVLPVSSAVTAVAVYLAIGACGLPVFSGFRGGFQVIAGPTGGYLLGYIACVLTEGFILRIKSDSIFMYIIATLCGTALLYTFGTVWFCISANSSLASALPLCVLPFLPGDAVKIIAVAFIATALKKAIGKHS